MSSFCTTAAVPDAGSACRPGRRGTHRHLRAFFRKVRLRRSSMEYTPAARCPSCWFTASRLNAHAPNWFSSMSTAPAAARVLLQAPCARATCRSSKMLLHSHRDESTANGRAYSAGGLQVVTTAYCLGRVDLKADGVDGKKSNFDVSHS